ncbi:(2R)-3-sulfolactate dehydrogenase (NADP+) [Angulomicrobium tetraedrale]|uniref:(2R)-3-sulfolactate dehydrogenase (NADP+) n=1 Tax=Ancylobacter tetraedralis TaxID=217068 RepID=A0A839Z4R9_9HYPH|nr:Ldh family oxidoreductase [Ancylobacter tetraedralis]MBB3769460.1 (2R)-3-sulfolactate dehydrogenase (NADP+) [Ancylobacter tetraedralis]
MTDASVRMTRQEIVDLALGALLNHGASTAQAAPLAAAIAAAECDGVASHGLMYLPVYCEHLACGKVRADAVPKLEEAADAVISIDADCGFAHPAIALGLPALVALARRRGLAALAVHQSYNCGVLGYHTEQIARAGLVGLGFTNAPASIAPVGGTRPVLGTNPWSLAVPDGAGGAAFVIDQSASVVAKSEVMKRARAGEPIPVGWALDAQGRPTTDAAAALKGSMAPSGGYKGFGAALLVEVMAACLTGATPGIAASPFSSPAGGPPRTGQFFLAIDPVATSDDAFAARLATVLAAMDEQGARRPGARKQAARRLSAEAGIAVNAATLERCTALLAPRDGGEAAS